MPSRISTQLKAEHDLLRQIRQRLTNAPAVQLALAQAKAAPGEPMPAVDQHELALDVAEGVMIEKALKGEPWAVVYLLKTLGKSRGYGESGDAGLMPGEANQGRVMVVLEPPKEPLDAPQEEAV